MTSYGLTEKEWVAAMSEGREILITCARDKKGSLITYSDLAAKIKSVRFECYERGFFHLLELISINCNNAGKGLLSALVVHKSDNKPGEGFYDLARRLGRKTSNKDSCWIKELEKVRKDFEAQHQVDNFCKAA